MDQKVQRVGLIQNSYVW